MAGQIFTLGELAKFDNGRIVEAVQMEINRCSQDCVMRPNEERARVATLKIELLPITDDRGVIEGVSLKFVAVSSIPTRKSSPYVLNVKQNGTLIYSENNPKDARQMHLDDQADKKKP